MLFMLRRHSSHEMKLSSQRRYRRKEKCFISEQRRKRSPTYELTRRKPLLKVLADYEGTNFLPLARC